MEATNSKEKNQVSGVLFVGCMFIGMGIGFLSGKIVPFMFIGMGIGFLAVSAYRLAKK